MLGLDINIMYKLKISNKIFWLLINQKSCFFHNKLGKKMGNCKWKKNNAMISVMLMTLAKNISHKHL